MPQAPPILAAALRHQDFFGNLRAPTLACTATATDKDISDIINMCDMERDVTQVIRMSPVKDCHLYYNVMRPPSVNKFKGCEDKPGIINLLKIIYLDKFVSDILGGKKPKKCIIFVQNLKEMMAISNYLTGKLKSTLNARNEMFPFVTNHSNVGEITADNIRFKSKTGSISLYISTSVMLLGIDIQELDIAILLRPFHQLHAFNQAGGRVGRRIGARLARKGAVFCLWNNTDLRAGFRTMSDTVRLFCREKGCLKEFVNKYFNKSNPKYVKTSEWCCSNCM